ncbi:MAG: asparagine synthase (glutamine-hydrolyzing) [Magnetococcales bacterium]|nr:asparagine synthase (glutamine-hydrolyzing) [Magnetococcales bacterium]
MCGFVGCVEPQCSLSSDRLERTIHRMNDQLSPRGPDDQAVWLDADAGVALGHRRLSIVDLSPMGRQPMKSPSGRYLFIYNGEVYNHEEMRPALEAKGVHFRGTSDTETLLAGFEQWGVEKTIRASIGMFAFALWDRQERRLTLGRDRLGIKPLYWGEVNGVLFFGSQPKAFRPHPKWRSELNRDAMEQMIRFGHVPTGSSIYQGIKQMEPGSILVWDRRGLTRSHRYWYPISVAAERPEHTGNQSDEQVDEALESLLKDAVSLRKLADVPLGAFLSGGIDSTAVVSLMAALGGEAPKTFAIGFEQSGYDESAHARKVSEHLGTDHREWIITEKDALAVIPSLAEIYDEPFADSSQIPTLLVSKLARQSVTVVLSGDGGDEGFAGYNRHKVASRISALQARGPFLLRRLASNLLHRISPAMWDHFGSILPASKRPRQLGMKMHKLADVLAHPDLLSTYTRLISFWPDGRSIRCDQDGRFLEDGRREDLLDEVSTLSDDLHPSELFQLLDLIFYLPDDILTKVDRASMHVGLEARVPLLDHRVVEYAWTLSPHQKLGTGEGKRPLRRLVDKHVPQALMERPKAGFALPVGEWLRGALKEWAQERLSTEHLKQQGLLRTEPISRLWQEHLSGARNHHQALWNILMFQEWHARWMEQSSSV